MTRKCVQKVSKFYECWSKRNSIFQTINIVVINFFFVHFYFKEEMDENETELGEDDFDDEEHEDSDELPEGGTKYFYNNKTFRLRKQDFLNTK